MEKILSDLAAIELEDWQYAMQRKPNLSSSAISNMQKRINRIIPEKVHQVITSAIKELTKGVLFGANFTTRLPDDLVTVEQREKRALERINFYCSSAAAEGAITGFGGFISGLADFPLWLSLKMKMMFEIAATYGFDTNNYKERLFILYVFQLAFSSQSQRNEVYKIVADWDQVKSTLPSDINEFDWRTFQLEYRDHIDLAKLLQLIPGIGAMVGALVNHRLTHRLGKMAINAYRMRMLNSIIRIEE
ncbi:EcsC family protein [Reichenbachiella versicolor]|uniref:EcsC family protein n=1 Tax=Reichenbachiella versicolor TaxID=1821036 RepID=UPI0016245A26|nr:EcsC family protein [Reichenbachiella versicolor]